MTRARTHYEILGVDPDADPEMLRAAWKVLVQVWHPDRFSGALRERAAEETAVINAAYSTLSVCEARERYDRTLEQSTIGLSAAAVQRARERRVCVELSDDEFTQPAAQLLTQIHELLRDMVATARQYPRIAASVAVVWFFLFSGVLVQHVTSGSSVPTAEASALQTRPAATPDAFEAADSAAPDLG
jgi:curved DNA-binding protein CbpA